MLLCITHITSYAAQYYQIEINGLFYNLDTYDKTAEVTQYYNGKRYYGDIVIPESVSYKGQEFKVSAIGNGAFSGCSNMTSVSLPESLKDIHDYAFRECSALTSIIIPNAVTYMGVSVFDGCSNLKSVVIGNSVKTINPYAFYGCNQLTTVTLGKDVKEIWKEAFKGCTAIEKLTCLATTPPDCEINTFSDINKHTCWLYVPTGCVFDYQHAPEWQEFLNISDKATAIRSVSVDDANVPETFYDMKGTKQLTPHKGINIAKMRGGITKKVINVSSAKTI